MLVPLCKISQTRDSRARKTKWYLDRGVRKVSASLIMPTSESLGVGGQGVAALEDPDKTSRGGLRRTGRGATLYCDHHGQTTIDRVVFEVLLAGHCMNLPLMILPAATFSLCLSNC